MVSPTVYELILESLIAPAVSTRRSQATGESMTSINACKRGNVAYAGSEWVQVEHDGSPDRNPERGEH